MGDNLAYQNNGNGSKSRNYGEEEQGVFSGIKEFLSPNRTSKMVSY